MKIEEITNSDVAIHCKTEEEANVLLSYLNSIGRTWKSGDSYIERNSYKLYGHETCYSFNAGMYGPLSWYQQHNWTVYEFDDFFGDDFLDKPEINMNFDDLFEE